MGFEENQANAAHEGKGDKNKDPITRRAKDVMQNIMPWTVDEANLPWNEDAAWKASVEVAETKASLAGPDGNKSLVEIYKKHLSPE